ncbi:hypothetical protein L917_12913, partial [Phytophthora nicotianae]
RERPLQCHIHVIHKNSVMATDLEFLDAVSAFLETEAHAVVSTPRTSFGGRFQQSQRGETAPTWAVVSPTEVPVDNDKNDTCEIEKSPCKANKRRNEALDERRKKYRLKSKNERDDLRQKAGELARKIQEMIDAREGRNTTARTDLVLSKSFWKDIAMEQKQQRLRSEAEHQTLLRIVNAQSVYIESIRMASCAPSRSLSLGGHDGIDDHKWLRLKSSVSSLYTTYLQEVDGGYTRIDQILQDSEVGSLSVGMFDSSYRYKPSGELQFFQHRYRVLQPFSLDETCRVMWDLATITNRQTDREGYNAVSDPDNTVAVRFRVQKRLSNGSTVSIMRHVVSRRFIKSNRVAIVWKIFSEGEGIFSGMDMDETGMISIRPLNDGPRSGTVLEFCTRLIPVSFLTTNSNDRAVKAFQQMMEDSISEDTRDITDQLGKRLQANYAATSSIEKLTSSLNNIYAD